MFHPTNCECTVCRTHQHVTERGSAHPRKHAPKHWLEEWLGDLQPNDTCIRLGVRHARELAAELAAYRAGLLEVESMLSGKSSAEYSVYAKALELAKK